MKSTACKEERINIRVTPEIKKLIERAAMLSHASITDFMLTTVRKAAERMIAETDTLILNNEERDRFMSLLNKPASPNEALKSAMLKHREHLKP